VLNSIKLIEKPYFVPGMLPVLLPIIFIILVPLVLSGTRPVASARDRPASR
jgi:hypothetical protein